MEKEDKEIVYAAENLVIIREAWGKTQAEMGELLGGLTRTNYAGYEQKRYDISPKILLKLEELTGIAARRIYYDKIERLEVYERPYRNENGIKILMEENSSYKSSADLMKELIAKFDKLEDRVKNLEKGSV